MTLDEYVKLSEASRKDKSKDKLIHTCPVCNSTFSLYLDEIQFHKFYRTPYNYIELVMFQCPVEKCNEVICYRYDVVLSVFDNIDEITESHLLFPRVCANVRNWPSYVPEKIVSDFTQALKLISISPEASIMMGRRALERIILIKWPDVALKGRDNSQLPSLSKMIDFVSNDALYEDGDILSSIQNIGNNATHIFSVDSDIEFSESDAKLVLKILELLIEDLFVKPEERNKLKDSITGLASQTKIDKKNMQKDTIRAAKGITS